MCFEKNVLTIPAGKKTFIIVIVHYSYDATYEFVIWKRPPPPQSSPAQTIRRIKTRIYILYIHARIVYVYIHCSERIKKKKKRSNRRVTIRTVLKQRRGRLVFKSHRSATSVEQSRLLRTALSVENCFVSVVTSRLLWPGASVTRERPRRRGEKIRRWRRGCGTRSFEQNAKSWDDERRVSFLVWRAISRQFDHSETFLWYF